MERRDDTDRTSGPAVTLFIAGTASGIPAPEILLRHEWICSHQSHSATSNSATASSWLPSTRLRGGPDGIPGDLIAEHYRQRAGVGLIIAEGTYVNFESQAFVGQPGIVTDEQAEGWRRVADAVHEPRRPHRAAVDARRTSDPPGCERWTARRRPERRRDRR